MFSMRSGQILVWSSYWLLPGPASRGLCLTTNPDGSGDHCDGPLDVGPEPASLSTWLTVDAPEIT